MSRDDKQWTIHDVTTGKELRKLDLSKVLREVVGYTYDAECRLFLVAYKDNTVVLWDAPAGQELCRFNVRPGDTLNRDLGISPDGRRAIGGTPNGVLYMWRLPSPPEKP